MRSCAHCEERHLDRDCPSRLPASAPPASGGPLASPPPSPPRDLGPPAASTSNAPTAVALPRTVAPPASSPAPDANPPVLSALRVTFRHVLLAPSTSRPSAGSLRKPPPGPLPDLAAIQPLGPASGGLNRTPALFSGRFPPAAPLLTLSLAAVHAQHHCHVDVPPLPPSTDFRRPPPAMAVLRLLAALVFYATSFGAAVLCILRRMLNYAPASSDPPPHPPRSPPPPSLHPIPWHLPRPALRPTQNHQRSLPAASLFAVFVWPLPLRAPPRDRSANPRRDHSPTLRLLNPWAPPPGDSTVRRRSSRGASRRPPSSPRYRWQPLTHNTTSTSTFPHSRHPRTPSSSKRASWPACMPPCPEPPSPPSGQSAAPPPWSPSQRPSCNSARLCSSVLLALVPPCSACSAGCSTTPRKRQTPPSSWPPLPRPHPCQATSNAPPLLSSILAKPGVPPPTPPRSPPTPTGPTGPQCTLTPAPLARPTHSPSLLRHQSPGAAPAAAHAALMPSLNATIPVPQDLARPSDAPPANHVWPSIAEPHAHPLGLSHRGLPWLPGGDATPDVPSSTEDTPSCGPACPNHGRPHLLQPPPPVPSPTSCAGAVPSPNTTSPPDLSQPQDTPPPPTPPPSPSC